MSGIFEDEVRHLCKLPEGAMPQSVIEIVSYLDPEGEMMYVTRHGGHEAISSALGLLRLAEISLYNDWMAETP